MEKEQKQYLEKLLDWCNDTYSEACKRSSCFVSGAKRFVFQFERTLFKAKLTLLSSVTPCDLARDYILL